MEQEPTVEIPEDKQREMKELVVGVTAVISPTIMQCGQGGFIVVLPKVGIRACSTFEEALEVVAQYSRDIFQAPVDGPRVLKKVWDQARTSIRNRADTVEATDVAKGMVAVGFLGVVTSVLIYAGLI